MQHFNKKQETSRLIAPLHKILLQIKGKILIRARSNAEGFDKVCLLCPFYLLSLCIFPIMVWVKDIDKARLWREPDNLTYIYAMVGPEYFIRRYFVRLSTRKRHSRIGQNTL